MMIRVRLKGGPGSGHRGHAGRPGKRGGSSPGTGAGLVSMPRHIANQVGEKIGNVDPVAVNVLNSVLVEDTWEHASVSELKDRIVTSLSEESGVDYDTTNEILKQWADTSNDTSMRALSLQQAAAEELGLELSDWQKGQIELAKAKSGYGSQPITDRASERAVIRAMYDQTQAHLRESGVAEDGHVTVFRGMKIRTDDMPALGIESTSSGTVLDYKGNAMESWSVSRGEADKFADLEYEEEGGKTGLVLRTRVPARNVISTAVTGLGAVREGEFVIVGSAVGSQVAIEWDYEDLDAW